MMGSKIYRINISSFTFGQKEISSIDFHKALKNGNLNTTRTQLNTMSFNVSEVQEGVLYYRNIWNEGEEQLFEKLTAEPIKEDGTWSA